MTTTRKGLLDTSAVLLLSAIDDPSVLPEFPLASAVTIAELSVGPLVARDDAERAAHQTVLQQVEADFDAIPFDDRAARDFGRAAASLRAADRLTVEDGWVYFVQGWSGVVTEVFDVELTPELYAAFDRAASALRPS